MPFTFSHPAAILPFSRLKPNWFSLTSLIFGSLSPDFEYFLRMEMYGNYSHTLQGVFFFNLPLVLLLSFVYHNIVRDNLIENLPVFLSTRLTNFTDFDWNNYFKKNVIIILVSALIGVASHIIWDAFTHADGYFVENIRGLKSVFHIGGVRLQVFKVLQHFSSLMGAIVVVLWVMKIPQNTETVLRKLTNYWPKVFVAFVAILLLRYYYGNIITDIKQWVVPFIASILAAIVIVPLYNKALIFFSSKQKA